jgi:uncharacterized membrane protein
MVKLVYSVLLALCGAVLVHIAIIFLIPRLSEPRIIAQLQALNQQRDPQVFSGDDVSTGVTGLDPFFHYRVCFYDLEDGPFQLASTGDVPFFSAALMAENGDVLFSITDRQTINRILNIEVRALSEQQRLSQNQAESTAVTGAVPVFVPDSTGYAIIRAFVPDKSWNEIADNFLNEIICQSGEASG